MGNIRKQTIISSILVYIGFFIGAFNTYLYVKEGHFTAEQFALTRIFFDVGQGDSSLIKLPTGETILIDGGPDNLVLNRLGEFLPFYKREIDLILISHWHDDHVVGLIEIIGTELF